LPNNIAPHEIWIGKKPDVGHLRVFGSKCWYTSPKENIKKLDDRTSEAILIGYLKNTKGYKLWDFKAQNVIISRDVLFNEEKQSTEICEQDDENDDESTNLTPNIKDVDVESVDDLDGTNDASGLDDVPILEFGAQAASEMLLVHDGHKQLSSRHALSRKHFIKQLRVTMLHNGNLQCPQSTNRS
jgi:hypothetical protein